MNDGAPDPDETLVYGTVVALDGQGVLLRGPSGSGKSDLAVRLIDEGAQLVCDDQTAVRRAGREVVARAPETIAGRIEIRGRGIVEVAALSEAPLRLVVDLKPGEAVERLPEPDSEEVLGIRLPRLELDPFTASAPARLRLSLNALATAPAGADNAREPQPRETAMRSETTAIRVVLVTGLSGAGRSTALKMLEDLGYEAIDNLPLDLMNELLGKSRIRRSIALGVDTRSRDFDVETVMAQLDQLLARRDIRITVVFVDCEDEVLQRRFTETRRRHPLAAGRPLADGIAAERRLLVPLRGRADVVVDTSHLTPPEFRRILAGHLQIEAGQGLSVFVTSFAYRNGIPREADIVIDVRFLDNPHYDEALRPLTGRDPAVVARIAQDPDFAPFLEDLQRMLARLLPRYDEEGKSYLTVAFGCTGGQHRSVAVAEEVARWLRAEGFAVGLDHRDIPRSCAPESVEQQRTRRP